MASTSRPVFSFLEHRKYIGQKSRVRCDWENAEREARKYGATLRAFTVRGRRSRYDVGHNRRR